MRTKVRLLVALAASTLVGAAGSAVRPPLVDDVSVTPAFFNPSIGQSATFSFLLSKGGELRVSVLDRDGYVVRSFDGQRAEAGSFSVRWDGRDDSGEILPDEAYSLRVDLSDATGRENYEPARGFQPVVEMPTVNYYSRSEGLLAYTLARPSRVHVQAGQATLDPRTNLSAGPVLRTIVDRAPRIAGSIVEKWNGYDESGAVYIADLPNFAMAILATSLPESSVITVGNRRQTFADYAIAHRPPSASKPRVFSVAAERHHSGLNALEDRSPSLRIVPRGDWSPGRKEWAVRSPLEVSVEIEAQQAPFFLSQGTTLILFVDDREVLSLENPSNPVQVSLVPRLVPPGSHRLAANWASKRGPSSVAVARVVVHAPPGS